MVIVCHARSPSGIQIQNMKARHTGSCHAIKWICINAAAQHIELHGDSVLLYLAQKLAVTP